MIVIAFEFNYQPFDLFAASSPPTGDFSVFRHPHSPAKKPKDEQVWMLRRLPYTAIVRQTYCPRLQTVTDFEFL